MRSIPGLALCTALVACGSDEPPPSGDASGDLPDLELRDVGFATPESALHDPQADVYLVSNISGDPFAVDGDGFISRIAPDGEVLALKWIEGGRGGVVLNAPKGMALDDAHLWIADIDHVRRFDRATGAPAGAVRVEGASFLNDVTIGPDGALYVTDSGFAPGFEPNGTDAVWRVTPDLRVEPFVRGASLGQPNGIATADRDLFLVTWGTGVFALVTADGLAAELELPAAQLDGVVRVGEGRWLVSSWAGRCIYAVAPTGTSEVRFGDLEAPADLGYDAARGRLLIPLFQSDSLLVRRL